MRALKEFFAALTLTFMRDRVRRAQYAQTQEERERLEGEAIQAFLDTIKLFELEREEVFRYLPRHLPPRVPEEAQHGPGDPQSREGTLRL